MDLRTAYRVLDVPLGASAALIKRHYRRKIAQLHPDRNSSPDAHVRTSEVNRAYRVIDEAGFPSEEQLHAREGRGAGAGARGAWYGDESAAGAEGSGFQDGPGGGSRREQASWESRRSAYGTRPPRGRTVARKVKLTLEEAIAGKTVTLTGYVTRPCEVCEGSGREYTKCADCAGTGRVSSPGARFGQRACVRCAGSGFRTVRCQACHGRGTGGRRTYEAKVRIPPGARPGSVLHAKARAPRRDGDPSGFRITVEILEHEVFHFEPAEDVRLAVVVPIHALEFLLREPQAVPTPWGDVAVEPDARPWIDVPEAGFPDRSTGRRGVLRVHWDLVTETGDSPELQAQLRELLARLKGHGTRQKDWQASVSRWKARVRRG